MLAARQRVDAAFTSLAATDAAIGESLQFTPDGLARRKRGHVRVETVRQEWDAASQAVHGATPDAAAEAHAHLLTDLRTMTAHAGDTSNLILDPDLDSSYAMDMTLLALPQTQQRTAGLLVWLQQAHGRRLTAADRRHLAVTAAFLREADRDRIVADAETSLNADADFYGASETLSRSAETGGGHLRRRRDRLRGCARHGGEQAWQGRSRARRRRRHSPRSRPASACGAPPRASSIACCSCASATTRRPACAPSA